ncbi:zinc finger protein 271-like [Oppia nitens]|uniref:zinc finger protein 271-like n=1 Tax=Oppia nitens TaxID=1686743 RepID=UPI0023DBAC7E|nr:zinc finger protein 271-like [Oppia nitens]
MASLTRSRGTKPKSIVWKYYTTTDETVDGGGGQPTLVCCFCGSQFTASVAKNATKLRLHLVRKCTAVPIDIKRNLDEDFDDTDSGCQYQMTTTTTTATNVGNNEEVGEEEEEMDIKHKIRLVINSKPTTTNNTKNTLKNKLSTKVNQKSYGNKYFNNNDNNNTTDEDTNERTADMFDVKQLSRAELEMKVESLVAENTRLNTRLQLCLKQTDALIQLTKRLEESMNFMERIDSINRIHSIRFEDMDPEIDILTDQLTTNNETVIELKQKLRSLEVKMFETQERQERRRRSTFSDGTLISKSPRPQSSIWKYFKFEENHTNDGLRVIVCMYCNKIFRHKNLNAFKSREHIVETCEKCPQEIKDKENYWSEPQPKSKVNIWSHFILTNEEDRTSAECRYCCHKYLYRNATKCRQHLVFKCQQIPDDIKESICNQCDESFLNSLPKPNEPIKTRLSNIWKHYNTSYDINGKESFSCMYCHQIYSTRNATKFRQHLIDRCEKVPDDTRNTLSTESIESNRTWTQTKVPVWTHFKLWEQSGKQMCKCIYCGITYAYRNATKCRIHLMLNCMKIPVDQRFDLRKEANELYTSALEAKNRVTITKPKQKKTLTKVISATGRKPKSKIWQHFEEFKDSKDEIVRRCKYCEHQFGSGTSRNATKLKDHIVMLCKSIPEDIKQEIVDHAVKYRKISGNKKVMEPMKVFECCWPGCDMKFPKKSRLLNHQKSHTGEVVRVPCDWPGCEWTGRTVHSLTLHKYIHTGEKPFECDWPGCEFRTAKPSSLCVHKMRHKNLLRYRCDWNDCPRIFLTSSQLKVHKMVHLGIKPHACQYCDKRYPQLNKLKVHQRKHHLNNI